MIYIVAFKQYYHTNLLMFLQVAVNILKAFVYNIASKFKGDANMNKDKFLALSSKQRVEVVNDLLKNKGYDLQQVADFISVNYSTFTKIMQEDDFVYIKRENQYYKFIRNPNAISAIDNSADELTAFLNENMDILKKIVEKHKANDDFTIDKKIFASKLSTKTFRMPEELYQQFVLTCEKEFPQLKIQDIIAQLLLDFSDKYK